ncbi:hypothetical protein O181_046860 [Austropuccinia psidii MF-1]|uniref:chitin deacetylase n=1 Tax=Austropuccinia psidii MF-1 TaxID=1389203 RepID=A0A9Q3HMM4_9BASI|nr:hypothetical protein [Austropuccinia psidii MF-1]
MFSTILQLFSLVLSIETCHQDLHLYRRQVQPQPQQQQQQQQQQQCTPYNFPPIQSILKTYPVVWEIANLSQPGLDPQALQSFNQIQNQIPNIPPKGTPTGDFSNTTPNYPRSDPDCWWTFGNCTTPKLNGLNPDIKSCPEPNTWGLTIDDGPNCSHNAYYDFLRQSKQQASLFYIGSNVIDWPLEAQRGLADGHEICAHTWSHRYMTSLNNEQAFAELYFTKKIIKTVLGITVQCWRPPFGDVDDRIRFIASKLGMSTILWDNDVNDFRYLTVGQAAVNSSYENLIKAATNGLFNNHGIVVLSHELNADTMNTNAAYLPKIQQAFKYVVPIAVCQNNSQPYVESGFTYPTFSEWAAGTRIKQLGKPVADPTATLNLPSTQSNTPSTLNPYSPSSSTPQNSKNSAHHLPIPSWKKLTLIALGFKLFI